jgi:hypothetical protein
MVFCWGVFESFFRKKAARGQKNNVSYCARAESGEQERYEVTRDGDEERQFMGTLDGKYSIDG